MLFEKKTPTASSITGAGLLILSGLLLTACSLDPAEFDDTYVAQSQVERYPIRVVEAPVKMNIHARASTLRTDQMNSVVGFAQDARNNVTSRITVRYSSGSANARQVAQQVVKVLADQGVPRSMIAAGSYSGTGSMVTLSFQRKVAVTTECGDWSQNLGGDASNGPYPNQGCAIQQNIAAMVATPEDLEQPRAMSPAVGSTRSAAIKKYNTDDATSASSSTSLSTGTSN